MAKLEMIRRPDAVGADSATGATERHPSGARSRPRAPARALLSAKTAFPLQSRLCYWPRPAPVFSRARALAAQPRRDPKGPRQNDRTRKLRYGGLAYLLRFSASPRRLLPCNLSPVPCNLPLPFHTAKQIIARGEPMTSDSRPNVVLILTDDQGPWAAGCCGNDEIRTPNIDRLAGEGVRLRNFFCASPVCSPARAQPHDRPDSLPARHPRLAPRGQHAAGRDGLPRQPDMLHRHPRRGWLHLRPERQVAPGRQSPAATRGSATGSPSPSVRANTTTPR